MWRGGIAFVSCLLVIGAVIGACDEKPKSPAKRAAPSVASAPKSASVAPPAPTITALPLSWKGGEPLVVLTYNVLATPIFAELRTKALLDVLKRSEAHIIALQEVEGWFLKALVAEPWVEARYHLSSRDGRHVAPGGQLILSRFPIKHLDVAVLPGRQRRTLVVAEMMVGGRRMGVATTHMESFLDDGPVRAQQLDAIFERLRRLPDAIVVGDLNFGDGEQPETEHLEPAYTDLWKRLHPSEPGFTWNMADNPLARIGAFVGEPDRRLDRILVRSKAWRGTMVAIVGDRPVGKRRLTPKLRRTIEMPERGSAAEAEDIEVFPSDHYGLRAEFAPASP